MWLTKSSEASNCRSGKNSVSLFGTRTYNPRYVNSCRSSYEQTNGTGIVVLTVFKSDSISWLPSSEAHLKNSCDLISCGFHIGRRLVVLCFELCFLLVRTLDVPVAAIPFVVLPFQAKSVSSSPLWEEGIMSHSTKRGVSSKQAYVGIAWYDGLNGHQRWNVLPP